MEASKSRSGGPEREGADQNDLRVIILLGCAAVFAAVVGAYAAILGDRGSDRWHQAIREDIRRGARIVSDARALFQDEAPVAHRIAQLELTGQALEAESQAADGAAAVVLANEARAQRETAELLASSSELGGGEPRGAVDLTGDELLERFGEIRSEVPPDLAALDPGEVEAAGADDQEASAWLVAATIAAGIALLLGALAEAIPPLRNRLTNAGFAVLGTGVLAVLLLVVL